MASMGSRLHEAAIEGRVDMLLELLQQDPLLLDMAILDGPGQTPLHVAALVGHTDFVEQILQIGPQLAQQLDSRRLSPLHLAAAKGHLEIVRLLLRVQLDTDLCLLRDADGRNPLQLAAMNGHVDALGALISSRPEAARTAVDQGGTILHLCVKNNQLEPLKMLIKAIDDTIFLNAKDDYGFTILHLAVSNKQTKTVEFLVRIKGMEVNAVNSNGLTALDVLVQSNRDAKDLDIAELLRAFGATRTTSVITPSSENGNQSSRTLPPPIFRNQSGGFNGSTNGRPSWLTSRREALMVVASLMAALAFQAGLNPPGGAWQDDQNSDPKHVAGKSIMASKYSDRFVSFVSFITVGFVLSLIDLFLLLVDLPSENSAFWSIVYFFIGGTFAMIGFAYWSVIKSLTPDSDMSKVIPQIWINFSAVCILMVLLLISRIQKLVASAGRKLIERFARQNVNP